MTLCIHRCLHWSLLAAVLMVATGCHSIDFYDETLEQPTPAPMEPPRELSMMSLPSYRIEPPDLLNIEMLKMVPLPPYRAATYDVMQIRAAGTLLDQPIDDFYMVEAEGFVNLGPAYGKVRVAGMTIPEAKDAITQYLSKILREPEVSVQLAKAADTQPVTGEYLVAPDGTVNLRKYGAVHIAGKTIPEAEIAIEKHLSQFFDSPNASVDVAGYNSKNYYIITAGAGNGDNIVSAPVTGNETVLDAISQLGGLSQVSSKDIWIARPAPGGFGCEQILPVDYDAITRGADSSTNYQLMPDDRLFVSDDQYIASSNFISQVLSPIRQLLGVTSLGVSTIKSSQTMGRNFSLRTGGL